MQRLPYTIVLAAWGGLLGCEASFVDLRPEGASLADAGDRPTDAGFLPGDAGAGDLGEGPATAIPVASGDWTGRSDYRASGTVSLVLEPSGQHLLVMSADFSVSGVPGPVVVLSRRDVLGNRIDPSQDIELGTLRSNTGAQSYEVPAGGDDRMWAWIFCKPFGVEVARARLEAVP